MKLVVHLQRSDIIEFQQSGIYPNRMVGFHLHNLPVYPCSLRDELWYLVSIAFVLKL